MRKSFLAPATALLAVVLAACSSTGATPAPSAASAAPSAAPSVAASASAAPSPTPDACAADKLALLTPGTFTIGTDNPAFPPYFAPRAGGNTAPWDPSQGDPTTGEGFESAVGFAIADKLGFAKDKVAWVVVPFANAFAPGPKPFDINLTQVTYTADRAQTVDLSDGYFFGPQTVVALKSSKFATAKTIAELQGAKFGVQVGTTSFDAIQNVIKPTTETAVFDTNDAAIQALGSKQVDAIVVDLPTAAFITNVQLDGSTIVGQLDAGQPEHFSAVLAKGSALTPCVNAAIKALDADGTLAGLVTKYLDFAATPVIAP
jgi:polar amino acid transport system substrate-binding protein